MCMSVAHSAFKFQQQCNRSQEILQAYCLSQRLKSDVFQEEIPLNENICTTNSNQNEELQQQHVEDKQTVEEKDEEPVIERESSEVVLPLKAEKVTFNCYIKTNGEKVYGCSLCSKAYKYSSSLKIHMRTHTQEKPYVCSICGKNFKQYGSLTYHHRSHTGEQPYVCKICGKRYRQSGSLTAHMRIHTGQRPFLCSVCGRGFR